MQNRDRLKNLALLFGFMVTFCCTAGLYMVFFAAYLNPQKATLVTINSFGEAHIELAMLLLAIPCICYLFYHVRRSA